MAGPPSSGCENTSFKRINNTLLLLVFGGKRYLFFFAPDLPTGTLVDGAILTKIPQIDGKEIENASILVRRT